MEMLALYLILFKVVFNGKGSPCHWDFFRRKKIACDDSFQFQRLLELFFNQPDIHSFGIRKQKFGRRIISRPFQVMVTFSSKRSVVRTFVAFGPVSAGLIAIVSSSKRLSKGEGRET